MGPSRGRGREAGGGAATRRGGAAAAPQQPAPPGTLSASGCSGLRSFLTQRARTGRVSATPTAPQWSRPFKGPAGSCFRPGLRPQTRTCGRSWSRRWRERGSTARLCAREWAADRPSAFTCSLTLIPSENAASRGSEVALFSEGRRQRRRRSWSRRAERSAAGRAGERRTNQRPRGRCAPRNGRVWASGADALGGCPEECARRGRGGARAQTRRLCPAWGKARPRQTTSLEKLHGTLRFVCHCKSQHLQYLVQHYAQVAVTPPPNNQVPTE